MEEGFIDRRKAPRVFIEIKFKYSIIGSASQDAKLVFSGVTKNISRTGMFFENLVQIPLNCKKAWTYKNSNFYQFD